MRRFGGGGAMDENDAAHYHERFTSSHADDREFDNNTYHQSATEYLGKLPDDQFQQAARSAYTQAPPAERSGMLGTLMGALGGGGAAAAAGGGGGGGLGGIAKMLGLGSSDPNQMGSEDYAKVMNHVRRERPELLQQQVQEKPWLMKAMGHPVVMGALAMAAAKMMSGRGKSGGGGGLF